MIEDFGEGEECFVLMITDVGEFFRRIDNALREKGYQCRKQLVKYRNTSMVYKENGKIEFNDCFCKGVEFAYQEEFRILVDTKVEDYLDFYIGNITSISKLMPAKKVINGLICTASRELKVVD